ncbi:hypothetical protein ACHAWF_006942 [Thalassiosira exigua]
MRSNQECQGPGVKVWMQQRCVVQGKMRWSNCRYCLNEHTQQEKIDLTIDSNKGMYPGESITLEGMADEKPGTNPGDLNFVIVQKKDGYFHFHRDGDGLYITIEIPLVETLLSFEHSFWFLCLYGHKFTVDVSGVTECDHVMHGGFGDMYITFDVEFLDSLTDEQRAGIRKILGGRGGDGGGSASEEY